MVNLLEKAQKLGYRLKLVERWISFWGEEFTEALLKANEQGVTRAIRVNTLRTSNTTLREQLEKKEFYLEKSKFVPNGLLIYNEPLPLGATTEYLLGYYTIQGIASQLPALVLEPHQHEKVLDMTAAPGGKATQIAAIMKNRGILICLDWSPRRLRALQFNMGRLNVQNQVILRMDAKKVEQIGIKFDKILLDAPCTGSGIIYKDFSRKKSRSEQDIQQMSKIQKILLRGGLNVLKKGGRLVYSTCSLEPEENEEVIAAVYSQGEVRMEKLDLGGTPGLINYKDKELDEKISYCQRFFPHTTKTEGFFICSLRKV